VQLAAGRHHDWVGELELMALAEPLREKRWELLALALYRDGRQADAMRTFRRARARLTEIGLDPGPSMRDLERAISVHDPTLAAAREPTRHEPVELQPELHAPEGLPFAGRSAEMLHMETVWQSVAAGRRRTIVIDGDAGVGKSRLAVEFSRACHARGATVFVGRCDPDVSPAYADWDSAHSDGAAPVLVGQHFHYASSPNRYRLPAFYELHVWAWKSNRSGTFTDWNPAVTCDEYTGAAGASNAGHGEAPG